MRKMKRVLIFLLTMALALGVLSGCSLNTGSKPADKIRIGVTLYDQYDTFVGQLMDRFMHCVTDDVDVVVLNAAQSQQTQRKVKETSHAIHKYSNKC